MSVTARNFARSTAPDMNALMTSLAALFPAHDAFISWDPSNAVVTISCGDWTPIDTVAVQTAVTNCAAGTYRSDAQQMLDDIGGNDGALQTLLVATILVTLDQINIIRTKTGTLPIGGSISIAQLKQAIKDKIATL